MCRTYFLNFAIANTTDLSQFAVFPYCRALGSVAQKCMLCVLNCEARK